MAKADIVCCIGDMVEKWACLHVKMVYYAVFVTGKKDSGCCLHEKLV